ncbi:MAG: hydrogenase expression/formation protein HypE [Deltaproteobacteria bacterium]|nr:hydrogenase expression/formation protein HypE [Deltaproteobacteria bacterium]MBI3756135.1 hydrogenase expression/formation protein HypE [Deltaproteobacteria bacterium]
MKDTISIGHGGGGRLARDLIKSVFLKHLSNPILAPLGDSAVFELNGSKLALTTDSYVVRPIFSPGTDIGKLAVCGTINDLSVVGAKPLYLSCALIIEEGFSLKDLEVVALSIKETAKKAGVEVITGDTKVIERSPGESQSNIYINTAGLGIVENGIDLGIGKITVCDKIILSGTMGDHGIAVLSKRDGFDFEATIESDCAPLNGIIQKIIKAGRIKFMRDPTRGGLAGVLNEIAEDGNLEIKIDEDSIPVRDDVKGICNMLGLDPLYIANEGKVVIIAAKDDACNILKALQNDPLGQNAAIIGEVTSKEKGKGVYLKTPYGGTRILDMPLDDLLPRIC